MSFRASSIELCRRRGRTRFEGFLEEDKADHRSSEGEDCANDTRENVRVVDEEWSVKVSRESFSWVRKVASEKRSRNELRVSDYGLLTRKVWAVWAYPIALPRDQARGKTENARA